jgi:hypothetical protein
VRDEIMKKFEKCSKLVVLIGDDTYKSDWVEWEINTFIRMKERLSGEKTWKRISCLTGAGEKRAPRKGVVYSNRFDRQAPSVVYL